MQIIMSAKVIWKHAMTPIYLGHEMSQDQSMLYVNSLRPSDAYMRQ